MPLEILSMDLFPFAATFLFVFAIVYGVLSITNVFGIKKTVSARVRKGSEYTEQSTSEISGHRKVNGLVAIVFGFFAASYPPTVAFVQEFLPIATILLIIIFFLALVKKLVIGDTSKSGGTNRDPVPVLALLACLIIFIAAAQSSGWITKLIPGVPGLELETILWVFGALAVVLIIWTAYRYADKKQTH
ncbi:MAG: hypothetical protein ABIG30_03835 [Candidatus Aenigmatarchaeota archaeon]